MYMLTDLPKTALRNDFLETFPRNVRSSKRNDSVIHHKPSICHW